MVAKAAISCPENRRGDTEVEVLDENTHSAKDARRSILFGRRRE